MEKGRLAAPLPDRRRSYLFFAAFFFAAFFAMWNPPLHSVVWIASGSPNDRRTLPPGTSARASTTSLRGLRPDAVGESGNS
jgi:hypothetical protein